MLNTIAFLTSFLLVSCGLSFLWIRSMKKELKKQEERNKRERLLGLARLTKPQQKEERQ